MTLVHVFNGPNLNLLGRREPAVYGSETLSDLEQRCRRAAAERDLGLDFRQSNLEGELVGWLHECGAEVAAGRRDHADVDVVECSGADPADLALGQGAQELGL